MEIKFSCSCGQRITVNADAVGQECPCPSCRVKLIVPDVDVLASATLPSHAPEVKTEPLVSPEPEAAPKPIPTPEFEATPEPVLRPYVVRDSTPPPCNYAISPDDSPSPPAKETLGYSQYSSFTLEQLQMAGVVYKRIPKFTREALSYYPWEEICANYSTLLTMAGIDAKVAQARQARLQPFIDSLNLPSIVPKREEKERPATDNQLNYLRALGVIDESFLEGLGIRQASVVIDHIKKSTKGCYD